MLQSEEGSYALWLCRIREGLKGFYKVFMRLVQALQQHRGNTGLMQGLYDPNEDSMGICTLGRACIGYVRPKTSHNASLA